MAGVATGMSTLARSAGSSTLARVDHHPRVVVSSSNDIKMAMTTKPCAPMGLPYLPGLGERAGLESAISKAVTCPGGLPDRHTRSRHLYGSDYDQRLKDTTRMNSVPSGGILAERGPAMCPRSQSTGAMPAGGRSRGARHSLSASCADLKDGYDPSKHAWYHPKGHAEELRLANQKEPGGWAWTMHKARDHGGFGEDGIVDKRDNVSTVVSGDTPDWFPGLRTVAGPRGTHKHPVRRCPFVTIEGKTVKVQARTYRLGENLSVHETYHDGPVPPTPKPAPKNKPHVFLEQDYHVAQHSNLHRSGCVLKPHVQAHALGRLGTETPRHLKVKAPDAARLTMAHGPKNTSLGHT